MLSNNAFARIHDRINNRMLYRLRKPFKQIREQYADERTVPDVTDELQEAVYAALVTGFVFGKGSVVIEVLKREKRFLDVADAQMIQFALGQDKDIWYLIAGKRLFKQIMSEPDAMAAYFSPSEGALSFLKSYSFDIAQVQMQNISEEAQELFKDTMLEGMSNEQAAKYLNSKIKNLTNLRARAIARTESTRAFNLGTLYESQSSAIVKGYRYNAVLDNLTTDICKARNGKFIPKSELTMIANNTPPLHVNCRSRLETVLDDEKEGEWMPTGGLPEPKQRPSDIQAVNQFLGMQSKPTVYTPPVTVQAKAKPTKAKADNPEAKEQAPVPTPKPKPVQKPKATPKAKPKPTPKTKPKKATTKRVKTVKAKPVTAENKKPKATNTETGISEEFETNFKKYEKEIRNRKTEKVYIFDEDGNVLFKKEGGGESVALDMRDSMRIHEIKATHNNVYSLHNHPTHNGVRGGSFSEGDFNFAVQSKQKLMRVTDEAGVYEMRFKKEIKDDVYLEIKKDLDLIHKKNGPYYQRGVNKFIERNNITDPHDPRLKKYKLQKTKFYTNEAWKEIEKKHPDYISYRSWKHD